MVSHVLLTWSCLWSLALPPAKATPASIPPEVVQVPVASIAGDATTRLSFRQAIERAMAFQLAPVLAGEDVALARVQTQNFVAASSPNFYVVATFTELDHTREVAGRALAARSQVNAYVGLTQQVLAPRLWGNLREAKNQEHVQWAAHRNARRSAAVAAAYAYLDVVAARRAVQVSRSASATDRAHLGIAEARLTAGISNRIDALRAADELAQSEGQLAASMAALAKSQESLGLLVGLHEPVDAADDAELLAPQVSAAAKGLRHAVPQGRADVELTERQLVQAQRIRRHSWLDFMPTLLATGQAFAQDPPTTSYPHLGWQLTLLATIPIWDGGVRQAALHSRQASERQAAYRLDAMERQADSEVRAALAVLRHAEAELVQGTRSAEAAGAAVGLTVRAYRGGTLGNLEVVDAERRNRDAQIRRAAAEDTLRRARLDLIVALGKFPEPLGEVHQD